MAYVDPKLQTFKIKDASSYDSVTEEFDLLTQELTQPLAARLVSLANLSPSQNILDIGTGTGVVAFEAAQQVGPGGKIIGVDLSLEMLKKARSKALNAGLNSRFDFVKMDAEVLSFRSGSFDIVLSLYALLHFPNPLSALKEMFRVLRPGGRLVLAVGSGPPLFSLAGFSRSIRHLYSFCLKRQGRLLTAPDFLVCLLRKYLPKSVEPEESGLARHSLNRTRSVLSLARKAGFEDLAEYWEGHDAVVDDAEDFWNLQRTFSSIARKRLLNAAPQQVEALRQEFLERCHRVQARGGKLVYPYAAFCVTGCRPM